MSDEALSEIVIAHDHIIAALIAAVRKNDALDLPLFNKLLEATREKYREEESGKYKIYNRILETAKSACLIADHQPKTSQ